MTENCRIDDCQKRLLMGELETIREQTIEECAKIAEQLADKPGWSPNYKNAAHKIAELIRSLAQTGVKR
jgi:hypothetical protein